MPMPNEALAETKQTTVLPKQDVIFGEGRQNVEKLQ